MDEQTRRRLERYQPNRPEIVDVNRPGIVGGS